ncbi:MAG: uroporphyrinogen decarboxylase family protein [Smithellaceae bacterium]|nr:uroporphyrinogen decarboxylase family protein [Smithellaceae bacterium]
MHVIFKLAKGLLYAHGLHLGKLDGYERLIASIYGRPDRVSILLQPYLYAMHLHGLSSQEFFRNPDAFIHASYNTVKYFGIDAWSPVFDFYNIEAEALGQSFKWDESREPFVDSSNYLIKDKKDLGRLCPPVAGESGRMPYVLAAYRRYRELMNMPPICYCCSPFTMAVLVRGLQRFVVDMYKDPSFAHDLMSFLTAEVVVPWIRRMIKEAGSSMVVMSDAQASPPIVSPALIREFCLPYVEKVIRATSTAQCTVVDTGTWGESRVKNATEILDIKTEMMRRGNNLHATRPYYLLVWYEDYDKVGIPAIRSYADKKKICLMLNVQHDLVGTGTHEQIVGLVRRLIREGAGDGRFAILINMVSAGTPPENVHAVVAAVKQYGRYPISPEILAEPFAMPVISPFPEWFKKYGLPV